MQNKLDDKESLYILVLKYWREEAFRKYPLDLKTDNKEAPEKRLETFIMVFSFQSTSRRTAFMVREACCEVICGPDKGA